MSFDYRWYPLHHVKKLGVEDYGKWKVWAVIGKGQKSCSVEGFVALSSMIRETASGPNTGYWRCSSGFGFGVGS